MITERQQEIIDLAVALAGDVQIKDINEWVDISHAVVDGERYATDSMHIKGQEFDSFDFLEWNVTYTVEFESGVDVEYDADFTKPHPPPPEITVYKDSESEGFEIVHPDRWTIENEWFEDELTHTLELETSVRHQKNR